MTATQMVQEELNKVKVMPNLVTKEDIVQCLFQQNTLKTKLGTFFNHERLNTVNVFILYFGAKWCTNCENVTQLLKEKYESHVETSEKSQVIFVSLDKDPQEQMNYLRDSHGNWPVVPFQSELRNQIISAFEITEIPRIIVIKATNGEIISEQGKVKFSPTAVTDS